MYTHNYIVKEKERDWNNVVVSLRLRGAEAVRYWKLMDAAKARNPYIDKSDVIRELFGLVEPNILTREELHFFRQREGDPPGISLGSITLTDPEEGKKKKSG